MELCHRGKGGSVRLRWGIGRVTGGWSGTSIYYVPNSGGIVLNLTPWSGGAGFRQRALNGDYAAGGAN